MITKIKNGDELLCIKDVVMIDDKIAFTKGKIYQSPQDECLVNNQGLTHVVNSISMEWENDHFADTEVDQLNLPTYYDNTHGSLYKVAQDRGWNAYLFDIVKRLERGGKKDPLRQEIEKSIGVLQLWLKESGQ